MKYGIISDTHITLEDDSEKVETIITQLQRIFKDVDEILHAGDVNEPFFLDELKKIAPVKCVAGEEDLIENLEKYIKFSIGSFNIGLIHKIPDNLEEFIAKEGVQILITGHTHVYLIENKPYKVLILNPGSVTHPIAPPEVKGFKKPIARPSVITLNIDENDAISTFLINLTT
jgi:putative phosphoesterase